MAKRIDGISPAPLNHEGLHFQSNRGGVLPEQSILRRVLFTQASPESWHTEHPWGVLVWLHVQPFHCLSNLKR